MILSRCVSSLCVVTAISLLGLACSSGGGSSSTATPAGPACATTSDCEGGLVCDTTAKKCVAQGCDDIKGPKCAAGQKCSGGKCVTATTSDAGGSGDGGSTADAGSTGGETATGGGDTGTTGGPDSTPIADTSTSGKDTTNPATNDKSCHKCSTEADCGDGYGCVNLLSGQFCAKKCSSVADCTAGFICDKASKDEQKYCVLTSYDCKGCAVDGCTGSQKCNYKASPPACLESKKQCEACLQDKDCDNGLRCVKFGSEKSCVPDCAAGQTCPDNSACVSYVVEASKACAFSAAKCCYGPGCVSGCKDCKTKCVAGSCAECTKNADCPSGTCNLPTYTCVTTATCPPANAPTKKFKKKDTGECVECTNDTHCASSGAGPKCNLQTNTCEKSSASNECSVCGGDFPGCIQLNGTWTCVECTTDEDCAKKNKGTCGGKSNTCSGSTGGGGTGVGPKNGTCKADSDCKNDPQNTFTLQCDVATGLCFDTAGKCDNIVAFCNAAAGSNCELAAAGGIPGMPGGGAPNASQCTCGTGGGSGGGATMNPLCTAIKGLLPNLANCDCAKDPKAKDCDNPLPLPGLPANCCDAGGGGGGLPGLDCLSKIGGTVDPMCFGGIKCKVSPVECMSGQPSTPKCGGSGF